MDKESVCDRPMLEMALGNIIAILDFTYQEIFSCLPEKQKEVLIVIAKERKVKAVTSTEFIKKYWLSSSNSVQSGLKGLWKKYCDTGRRGGRSMINF